MGQAGEVVKILSTDKGKLASSSTAPSYRTSSRLTSPEMRSGSGENPAWLSVRPAAGK